MKCVECNGIGERFSLWPSRFYREMCPRCEGKGEFVCPICNGERDFDGDLFPACGGIGSAGFCG